MVGLDRQERIMNYLTENGSASVHRLAREVYASEATIRRDLAALESAGRLRRIYGGAVLAEVLNREVPLVLREQEHQAEKDLIARRAVELVSDGDTIFLDASSTAYWMVRYLSRFQDLTVITNGPKTSLALGARNIVNFCAGGLLLKDSVSYVGQQTCDFFRHFNADIMFFSCRGVSRQGMLCDSSMEESHVREAMMSYARKKVFLCDSSKLGRDYRYNICRLSEMDEVLCEHTQLPQPYQGIWKR